MATRAKIVAAAPNATAADILMSAAEIITGQRQQEYGPPGECFARIAAYWSTYLGHLVTPADVCQMMVLLKVARGTGQDTCTDAAGYAALAYQMTQEGGE